MASIAEAVSQAKRMLLPVQGIVAVSSSGNTVVVYVETDADRAKVPATILGYPVQVKVVGKVGLLS